MVYHEKLIEEIKKMLSIQDNNKEWLRSSEVRKMLKISNGTLQTLRIKGLISFKKINGIIFYSKQGIEDMMEGK